MDHSKLFYVLNGLLNGERGVRAMKAGGGRDADQLKDGHYYLLEDEVDGVGPFVSEQDAWEAGRKAERTQTWAFPLEGSDPFKIDSDFFVGDDAHNIATIEEVFNGNQSEYYECSIEGAYETLTLRISCGSFEAAADVFRHTILVASKYQ